MHALTPEPQPRLFIRFAGKGTGTVLSAPGDLACTSHCAAVFEPGTRIRLVAAVGAGSTFEGWSPTCTPRTDWILDCDLTLEGDTRVEVSFGLVPETVDVAWVKPDRTEEPEALALRLPDPEIEAELLEQPAPEQPAPEQPAPEQPVELALVPPPPSPPPPPPDTAKMRSVEVADTSEVEKAPDDARYLSDKDRDVAEETRATDTNLERAVAGDTAVTEQSDIESDEVGATEDTVAELEDRENTSLEQDQASEPVQSGKDREMAMISGTQGRDGRDGQGGDDRPSQAPGALSMRNIEGRGSLLPPGQGGESGKPGRPGKPGIKTQLDFSDYERIVGKDAIERELALGRETRKSTRQGRFEAKAAAVKAALETYTPEVKTGNQTALKTRASPFAVYLASMHRRIHELWAHGFLQDLNGKPSTYPLNNLALHTKIEIVMNPDGTVNKTTIVKPSGLLEFDVAAIDVILSGAPYAAPPEAIRSPDGRVYIHWAFHRDPREACAEWNAQPFILSEAPRSGGMDDSAMARNVPRRSRPAGQAGAREDGAREGGAREDGAREDGAREGAASPDAPRAGAPPSTALPLPEDTQAVHTANLWLTGFKHGGMDKMLRVTGVPFVVGESLSIPAVAQVERVYRTVLEETRAEVNEWKLMTPAGYRKRFSRLPPGVEEGKPQLLMVIRSGKQILALVLSRRDDGSYQITGLHR